MNADLTPEAAQTLAATHPDPVLLRAWASDIRAGKWQQTCFRLRGIIDGVTCHCILGTAVDKFEPERWDLVRGEYDFGRVLGTRGSYDDLPKLLGSGYRYDRTGSAGNPYDILFQANDHGATFAELADFIDQIAGMAQ